MNSDLGAAAYALTARNRVRRMHKLGSYARADVHAVLDAAPICNVAYVIDGQPYATPTMHWRDGERVYWHGSAASRFLEQVDGRQTCLTCSIVDGLVLARSAFNHSANYRSAMVFGRAEVLRAAAEKIAALRLFMDRLFPGRWDELRPMTDAELKGTAVMSLFIEEASVKARTGPPDDAADASWPVWGGVLPLRTVFGAPEPAPDIASGPLEAPPPPWPRQGPAKG
jgi:nitroimidazol reductase NimA-like FMN-containing flavoprotein (pyridoxamine 5'-phosphate oxidase superfamily)